MEKYRCINCQTVYDEIPKQRYEDEYGGGELEFCDVCGCDMFEPIEYVNGKWKSKLYK